MIADNKPNFSLGSVVTTPGALQALTESGQEAFEFLNRHIRCDWGLLCPEDRDANDHALHYGTRLLSAYETNQGVRLWVITEADRSFSTVLLPEEY